VCEDLNKKELEEKVKEWNEQNKKFESQKFYMVFIYTAIFYTILYIYEKYSIENGVYFWKEFLFDGLILTFIFGLIVGFLYKVFEPSKELPMDIPYKVTHLSEAFALVLIINIISIVIYANFFDDKKLIYSVSDGNITIDGKTIEISNNRAFMIYDKKFYYKKTPYKRNGIYILNLDSKNCIKYAKGKFFFLDKTPIIFAPEMTNNPNWQLIEDWKSSYSTITYIGSNFDLGIIQEGQRIKVYPNKEYIYIKKFKCR